MLVVCAAVGVAIAGVPHRSSEPAIRLTNSAAGTAADASTSVVEDTTTSVDPTTTAPTTTTTTKATTTTAKAKKAAAPAKPAVATTTAVAVYSHISVRVPGCAAPLRA